MSRRSVRYPTCNPAIFRLFPHIYLNQHNLNLLSRFDPVVFYLVHVLFWFLSDWVLIHIVQVLIHLSTFVLLIPIVQVLIHIIILVLVIYIVRYSLT